MCLSVSSKVAQTCCGGLRFFPRTRHRAERGNFRRELLGAKLRGWRSPGLDGQGASGGRRIIGKAS